MVEGPGTDTTVTPFDETPFYFTSDDDRRVVDAPASFPNTGTYERITLHLSLECPPGGCDPWARLASLGLLTAKDPAGDTVIELMRFITPYHVGASWDLDVTDLRPLLAGEVTLRAFIDTRVGPGSPYGDGWLLHATFEMKGGVPAKIPVAVIPVWSPRRVIYGDPARPIAGTAPLANVLLPAGASSYALRSFITGHGQGNAGNCAEFCEKEHTITVGAVPHAEGSGATTAPPRPRPVSRAPTSIRAPAGARAPTCAAGPSSSRPTSRGPGRRRWRTTSPATKTPVGPTAPVATGARWGPGAPTMAGPIRSRGTSCRPC